MPLSRYARAQPSRYCRLPASDRGSRQIRCAWSTCCHVTVAAAPLRKLLITYSRMFSDKGVKAGTCFAVFEETRTRTTLEAEHPNKGTQYPSYYYFTGGRAFSIQNDVRPSPYLRLNSRLFKLIDLKVVLAALAAVLRDPRYTINSQGSLSPVAPCHFYLHFFPALRIPPPANHSQQPPSSSHICSIMS